MTLAQFPSGPAARVPALSGQVVAVAAGEPLLTARVAESLRLDGARVALLGDEPTLRATCAALGAQAGAFFAVPALADDPVEVASALDDIVDRYLRLDALVGLVQMPPRGSRGAGLPDGGISADDWDARVSSPLRRMQWLATAALRHMQVGCHRGLVLMLHAPAERLPTLESDVLLQALLGLGDGLCCEGRGLGIEARVLHAPGDALGVAPPEHRLLVKALLDEAVPAGERRQAGVVLSARWLCRLMHQGLLRPAIEPAAPYVAAAPPHDPAHDPAPTTVAQTPSRAAAGARAVSGHATLPAQGRAGTLAQHPSASGAAAPFGRWAPGA